MDNPFRSSADSPTSLYLIRFQRLLTQEEALKRGSIKAVDWSDVASPDLAFTREVLSRGWRLLCKASLPDKLKDAKLKEQLEHLLPGVRDRFKEHEAAQRASTGSPIKRWKNGRDVADLGDEIDSDEDA